MAAPSKHLTTTSYAILGLLSLRPWTTYELAEQMQRALGQFWPPRDQRPVRGTQEAGPAFGTTSSNVAALAGPQHNTSAVTAPRRG